MRGIFFTVFTLVAAVAAQAPYTGPCSDTACGVESENCDVQGRQCFPFPNIAPALQHGIGTWHISDYFGAKDIEDTSIVTSIARFWLLITAN
ncbi:hypothetical protein CABS01_00276 [Colletotrichum abscissum]|uniref:uncharacterized protein n=1 Tax=Colletotrichum abscissum TaxID=1671311 RepID=UPI0027D75FBD|nr:uncharacterized protein CABS01_00276 [Colletotrichum abscissum]KAK1525187.1 hypothetical protein CABS01_00276 [Colletotrichum abscissum]